MQYFPLALPFLLLLFFLVAFVIVSVEIGILEYAYEKVGVNRRYVFTLLVLSLLGSYVNIPVAQLPPERIVTDQEVTFFGMRYVIPMVKDLQQTIIAVNLGGAIIPTLLSLYLLVKNQLYVRGLIGVVLVTAIVHSMAHPVRGMGIAVPTFIPPLVAAAVALLKRKPHPDDADIDALPNLCRCGTYPRIRAAIKQASQSA